MVLMLTWCWSVVLRILSRVRLAGESSAVGGVCLGDRPVRVYCLYGVGFGSDVTVVARLDD